MSYFLKVSMCKFQRYRLVQAYLDNEMTVTFLIHAFQGSKHGKKISFLRCSHQSINTCENICHISSNTLFNIVIQLPKENISQHIASAHVLIYMGQSWIWHYKLLICSIWIELTKTPNSFPIQIDKAIYTICDIYLRINN